MSRFGISVFWYYINIFERYAKFIYVPVFIYMLYALQNKQSITYTIPVITIDNNGKMIVWSGENDLISIKNRVSKVSTEVANALWFTSMNPEKTRAKLTGIFDYFDDSSAAFDQFKKEARKSIDESKVGSSIFVSENEQTHFVAEKHSWVTKIDGTIIKNKDDFQKGQKVRLILAFRKAQGEEINQKFQPFFINEMEVSYL
ncbi:MAG: hypothetical protein AB8G05_06910 [Oligoflexales bacterium]